MTGAYLPDTPDFLGRPHGHVARATLTHPTFGQLDVPIPAERSSAVVAFDERSAPRVEARLVVPLLPELADVDPRTGVRLELAAGYLRPDAGEDVAELADLGLRRTPRNYAAGLVELVARSDEALVIDAAPAVSEKLTGVTPAAAVEQLLRRTINPAPHIGTTLTSAGSVTLDPIEDRWSALQDLADRYGAQAFDDGTRTWHVAPAPELAATPVHTLTVGNGGTVLEPVEDVDRDTWANYVLLLYRWRDAAGVDQEIRATAYVIDGPYSITGPAGRRIFKDERQVHTTQAAANAAAAAVLQRQLARAVTMRIRAVSAYWLRPGHTIAVDTGTGPRLALVSRVSFDLVAGVMDVVTRGDTTDTTAALGVPSTSTPPAAPRVADPAPPTKLAYVTEWPASSTTTYQGDGDKRTDVDAGDLWQGWFSGGFNGNQRSVALFTAANSTPAAGKRGETGKTIAQAIGGLPESDVSRVELVATLEHAWGSAADVVIGYLAVTSAPSSAPTTRPYLTSKAWPEGSRRTVNVTRWPLVRDLIDGTARALTFGPGPELSTRYYARLGSLRLRIHYAK